MAFALTAPLRLQIRQWMLRAFPRVPGGIDYDLPPGDPGLFPPDGVTWRVHADFPGMLSLLLTLSYAAQGFLRAAEPHKAGCHKLPSYRTSTSSMASRLGPSIMAARVSPSV